VRLNISSHNAVIVLKKKSVCVSFLSKVKKKNIATCISINIYINLVENGAFVLQE